MLKKFKYKLQTETLAYLIFAGNSKLRFIVTQATYIGDGIVTSHYLPFLEPKILRSFSSSFDHVPSRLKTLRDIQWRFQILIWAMGSTQRVKGEVVECGVWYGILSKSLMNYFHESDYRKFYLYDSWGEDGFLMDGPYKKDNYKEDIFDIVVKRFKQTNSVLVRGSLPKTLHTSLPQYISLLLIDLNSGNLESDVLEICWPKIPSGGIVYFDDYGQNFPLIRESIDKFVEKFCQNLLIFPTGQAILIKR
jgi:hypothetical protein